MAPLTRGVSIQKRRWVVHLLLISTAIISLVFEGSQQIHILLGLIFVVFVGFHFAQRRKISTVLLQQLFKAQKLSNPLVRLAFSDLLLTFLSVGMLGTGLLDWWLGHPTKIRWHAIFGVLLTIYLIVHSFRRRKRIRVSQIH